MRYLTFALTKGRLADKTLAMLEKIGVTCEEMKDKNSRKLIFVNEELKLKFFLAKGPDVPTYVEYGAADIGIIGKDVLNEERKDIYELLDMGYGGCHLMMAVPEAKVLPEITDYAHMRVATKYPKCAADFFDKLGMQMEIIKLNGSIELGPIVGLSEMIVDIVQTGRTLRENHLKEVATVFPSTARLIANKVSFKMQYDRIRKLVEDLKVVLKEEKPE